MDVWRVECENPRYRSWEDSGAQRFYIAAIRPTYKEALKLAKDEVSTDKSWRCSVQQIKDVCESGPRR